MATRALSLSAAPAPRILTPLPRPTADTEPLDAGLKLVIDASRGSRGAFEALWHRYAPTVYGILLSMVHDQEADDLMQDVVVSALDSIHTLRKPESFPAWLCAIARNHGRNALGRKKLGQRPLAEVDDVRTAPPSSAEVEADEILDHLRALPECYREPLVLRLVLRMTGPEIAKRTGMTQGSVRVNLHRGMQMLRRRLQHWE